MEEIADKQIIDAFIQEQIGWKRSLHKSYTPEPVFVSLHSANKVLLIVNSVSTPERRAIVDLLIKYEKLTKKEMNAILGLTERKLAVAINLMLESGIVQVKAGKRNKTYCYLNEQMLKRLNKVFNDAAGFPTTRRPLKRQLAGSAS